MLIIEIIYGVMSMNCKICPWWLGYVLNNPLRKRLYNPDKILAPYVSPGMNILEVGCGMGFFSIPCTKMLGNSGRLYAVDIQPKMIETLKKSAIKNGLSSTIVPIKCSEISLELSKLNLQFDFSFLFAVAHEVPDQARLFREIHDVIKPGAKLLLAEPAGHVRKIDFVKSLDIAKQSGFQIISNPVIAKSYTALLIKV